MSGHAEQKRQHELIAQLSLAAAVVVAVPCVLAAVESDGTVNGRADVIRAAGLALPLTLGVFICTVGAFVLVGGWDQFPSDDARLAAILIGLVGGVTLGAMIGAELQGLSLSDEIESFVNDTASQARGGRFGWALTALLYVAFFAQFYVDTYGPLTALTAACGGAYFGLKTVQTYHRVNLLSRQRAEHARNRESAERANATAAARHKKLQEKRAAERRAAEKPAAEKSARRVARQSTAPAPVPTGPAELARLLAEEMPIGPVEAPDVGPDRSERRAVGKRAAEKLAPRTAEKPAGRGPAPAGLAEITARALADRGSIVPIEAPDLGSDTSGVLRWYADPHQHVEAGARLAKITTKSSQFSIDAPFGGAVKYAEVSSGASVYAGQRLGEFSSGGAVLPSQPDRTLDR